jgi:hypothetical protein
LLKVLSNKEFAHIITWMPSGKSFNMLKPKAFTSEILPDYFKSAKYSSFTRKLHRWGFTRLYKGDEAGAFYHKDFQRDRLDLVEKMTCLKTTEVPTKNDPMETSATDIVVPRGAVSSGVQEPIIRRSSLPSIQYGGVVLQQAVRRASAAAPLPQHTIPAIMQPPLPKQQMNIPPPRSLPTTTQHVNVPELPRNHSLNVAAKINAAIELEVSRRLQERIKAAAAQMSQISRASAGGLGALFSAQPRTIPLNNHDSLRAKLIQMQKQKEQLQILAMTGMVPIPSHGLGEMPRTNIQGAKTA